MNTPGSQFVVFRPQARLISLLGEQLISDQAVGLIELVKNAYDADATRVEIELLELTSPETTRIVLQDNGFGMTQQDIEQRWLSPAVSHKERQKKARQRTPLGRLPIGEKGVGRFAVQQMGHKFQMVSRSAHSLEVVVEINWDDFDREDTYLEDVRVVLFEREPILFTNGATGTFLKIEQARTLWTEPLIAKVQRALRRLQSPHQVQGMIDFQIVLLCPDFPAFQNISNSDILEHAHYTFAGMVREEGLLDYEYSCHHPAVSERCVTVDDYDLVPAARNEMFSSEKNSSGPFYLNFYVWDRTQEYLNQSNVSRTDLDAMAGVSIFRDGLRVLPYGEPGNDWLDLDKERINAPAERIGNQQIIGFVEVFQENTPDLRDKTNREGLIDNAAFRDLRALVRATINVFTSQWLQDRLKMEKRSKASSPETSRGSLQRARVLAEKVRETARDDIIVKIDEPSLLLTVQPQDQKFTSSPGNVDQSRQALQNNQLSVQRIEQQNDVSPPFFQLTQQQALQQLLDYLQEATTYQQKNDTSTEERIRLLLHLAATGMAAERVVHEFGRQVNAALDALRILRDHILGESELVEAIRSLDICLGTLRNEFRVLAPYETAWRLQRTIQISAIESARLAVKLNEQLIRSADLTVEIEGEDFDILARPASLVQVLDNLVHNASIWLKGWRSSRHLSIMLDRDARTITITDTGPGIPPHLREHIFKPFVSLRNGGRGLGLYITQELLREMQGDIQLDADYGQGARFILQFPASKKD